MSKSNQERARCRVCGTHYALPGQTVCGNHGGQSLASAIRRAKLTDVAPDPANANRGTERGAAALERSLRELGAGRSILLDKHGVAIAGNKTLQKAAELGFDELLIVPTDGRQLVAVQRTDLDLAEPAARKLALADNRIGELDLEWDAEALKQLPAEVTEGLWTAEELRAMLGNYIHEYRGPSVHPKSPPRNLRSASISPLTNERD